MQPASAAYDVAVLVVLGGRVPTELGIRHQRRERKYKQEYYFSPLCFLLFE